MGVGLELETAANKTRTARKKAPSIEKDVRSPYREPYHRKDSSVVLVLLEGLKLADLHQTKFMYHFI